MKQRGIIYFFIWIIIFGLTACHSKQEAEKSPSEVQPKGKPSVYTYPLTGKPADHKVMNRPIGVMVENSRPARPQTGLNKADIVYEALAEGTITRFLAIYQSEHPEIIGPVRSARPYFVELSQGYRSIYVHHGWSKQAKALIEQSGINNLNGLYYDGTLFHREAFRSAPHNSYIPYENIIKGAKENHFELKADIDPLPFLNKDEINGLSGEKATGVTIDYLHQYEVRFAYLPDSKTYQRYSDGERSVDRKTKKPITVSNVLIVAVPTRFIDSYPRRGMDLKAGGEALLLQNGNVRKLRWENKNGRILPVEDGKVQGFIPGKTWVNLVPADPGIAGSVKISESDDHATG